MARFTRTVFCALVVLSQACGSSQSVILSPSTLEIESATTVERSFEIRRGPQLAGFAQSRQTVHNDGSREIHDTMDLVLVRKIQGTSDTFHIRESTHTRYNDDLSLDFETSLQREAGIEEQQRIQVQGNALRGDWQGPALDEHKSFPLPTDFRTRISVFAELLQEFKTRGGAPGNPGPSIHFSEFSGTRRRFESHTMKLEGPVTFDHDGREISGWKVRATTDEGAVSSVILDDLGMPMHQVFEGGFELVWVTNTQGPRPVPGLTLSSQIPVRGPKIRQWTRLNTLRLMLHIENDDDLTRPAIFSNNRYHKTERGPSLYRLDLSSTALQTTFRAPALPFVAIPTDVLVYQTPTAQAQSDAPPIRALADKLRSDEIDSRTVAESIVAWVHHNLEKQAGIRGRATATEALLTRSGDCSEHAVLVVALARAAKIPARQVDGIVLVADEEGTFLAGYHAWAELWLGRWVPVDAVVNEVGTSARYLAFGYNEPGHPSTAAPMVRTLGNTRISIEDYSLRAPSPDPRPPR